MTWGNEIMRKNTATAIERAEKEVTNCFTNLIADIPKNPSSLVKQSIVSKSPPLKELQELSRDFSTLMKEVEVEQKKITSSVKLINAHFKVNTHDTDFFTRPVDVIDKSAEKIRELFKNFHSKISRHIELHPSSTQEKLVASLALLEKAIVTALRRTINNDHGQVGMGENGKYNGQGGSILLKAVLRNNIPAVKELLKLHDIDPNKGLCTYESAKKFKAFSPLSEAIERNREEIVDLLLADKRINIFQGRIYPDYRMDKYLVNRRVKTRKLPLDIALNKKNPHIINALLQKGAGMMNVTCNVDQAIENGVKFEDVFTMGIHTSFMNSIPTRKQHGFEKAITNIDELNNSFLHVRSRMKILCEQYKNSTPDKKHDDGIALCNRIEEALEDPERLKVGVDFDDRSLGTSLTLELKM